MSTGGMYNPNLLPDMKGKKGFWSSSVPSNNAARAFYFNGTSGSLASFRSRTSYYSVRCVRDFDVVQPPGEVQVDPNTIIPVMDDDPRISDAFRRLGNMYQVGGLIWSGMAPNQMNHPDATQYCQDLGGGARLPTKNEWEALRQAMSTGGMYNPNLIPDMQHLFWSSSINLFNSDFAFCFDGNGVHACSYDDGRLYNYSVRCVIKGTTTQQQQTITSSSNSVSRSTKKLIANFHSIVQVAPSDPRVSHDFAALGAVHETAGLIWSAVTPENMNQAAAIQYCQGLGGGARLPTKEEWEVLKQVMTIPSGKYSPKLLPGTKGKWFWSSSVHPTYAVSAFYFDGSNGGVGRDNRYSFYSVRCVIGGVTTQQQQAVASSSNSVSSSSQSVPTQSSHAIGLIASNDLRVTRSFAALGNMYQVGELIWSGVAPKEMNQREAERFCQALGQGARLPTKEEWEVLKQVMTIPSRNFNPELLPGTKGKWFWSSSVGPNDAENAFHFYGTFGYVGSFSRHINASVRA